MMWIKLLKVLCFFLYFSIKSATIDFVSRSSYSIFIESIFETPVPFLTIALESHCVINLNGQSLEFDCSESLYKTQMEGSFELDANAIAMYNCLPKRRLHHIILRSVDHCKMPQKYYLKGIFEKCNRRNVQDIKIVDQRERYGYNFSEYLDFLASSFHNVNQIEYTQKFEKCNHLKSFFRRFKNLNKLVMKFKIFANCSDYVYTNLTQIKELQILINYIPEYNGNCFSLNNENLLGGMKNLEIFELNFMYKTFKVDIGRNIFKGLTKLTTLRFVKCKLINLTEYHFQDLVNLTTVTVQGGSVNDYDWLSLQFIQNKLMFLELDKDILHQNPNITAFLCNKSNNCKFNVDIHKKPCPSGCNCYLKRSQLQFKINCTNSEIGMEIPELPIPITGKVFLYFNNRTLNQLPNLTLYGYSNINELHVANNKLRILTTDQLPNYLTYLDLRNNSLETLDSKVLDFIQRRAGELSMRLSGNPWKCNCGMLQLLDDSSNTVGDRDQTRLICLKERNGIWIFLLNVGFCKPYFYVNCGLLLGFATIILSLFCLKKSILMWLYERNLCHSLVSSPEPETDTALKIDGFLAFSHVDLELVEEFVQKLEKGTRTYKLCFYQRDWLIGESIPACILNSIEDSRRVIILMTNNFINSSWGMFEFRTAIQATSKNKDKRLIVILYPGVDIDKLDSELKIYMKYNTYLRRDDPQFWRKLIFAMPHKQITCSHPAYSEDRAIEEHPL